MSSHTPGPWELAARYDNEFYVCGTGKPGLHDDSPDLETALRGFFEANRIAKVTTSEADAALIAAAPELLEALEDYVSNDESIVICGGDESEEDESRRVGGRALIRKAKGEQE